MKAEKAAINTVSGKLSSATAIRMNGRFTDMFPVVPGSLIFSREATMAMIRKDRNRTGSLHSHRSSPPARAVTPTAAIAPMKSFALMVMFFIGVSFRSSSRLLTGDGAGAANRTIAGVAGAHALHDGVTPHHAVAPDDAEAGGGAVAPDHRVAPDDG